MEQKLEIWEKIGKLVSLHGKNDLLDVATLQEGRKDKLQFYQCGCRIALTFYETRGGGGEGDRDGGGSRGGGGMGEKGEKGDISMQRQHTKWDN